MAVLPCTRGPAHAHLVAVVRRSARARASVRRMSDSSCRVVIGAPSTAGALARSSR